MNETKCERYHTFITSGGNCVDCGVSSITATDSHQSEKPQPEQWCEELEMYKKSATEAIMTFDPKHTFCTICGTDPEKLITHLKGVLDSVLLAQKEQMLEGLREMRQNPETSHYATFANLLDGGESLRRVAGIYNSALEDVEEKLKGL